MKKHLYLAIFFILFLSLLILSAIIFYRREKDERISPIKTGVIDYVNITILIDNNAYNDFRYPWGISLYIETPKETILFDTGPSPSDLEYNCKILDINLSKIDIIVLSHEHGDHVGGLSYVAKYAHNAVVYVPSGMSVSVKNWIKELGFDVINVKHTIAVSEGIMIIGELYGPPYEQALAINIKDLGLVIFVGCSHPRVDKIVHKIVVESGNVPYLVLGGFHMASTPEERIKKVISNLIEDGIDYIAPIHCSGDNFRNIMNKDFHDKYLELHVGSKILINSTGVYTKD